MFLPTKNQIKNQQKKSEIITYKNIGEINKSNKIVQNCWLSRYKRSR